MSTSSETTATRLEVQRISTHILARARKAADGEISLRIGLTGIATPAFGEHREVLRFAGPLLVRELVTDAGAKSRVIRVPGSSLAELAEFAGVDLDADLDFGHDAPPVGDRSQPINFDEARAAALLRWYQIGAAALDQILAATDSPSLVQLWPEHFDVAIDAQTPSGGVNLGASPADAGTPEHYLYVGPHTDARPGDAGFWNAPFGAVLGSAAVLAQADPVTDAVDFFSRGLRLLD